MTKTDIQTILQNPYNRNVWVEFLKLTFGGNYRNDVPTTLLNNDITDSAYEIGQFTTTDNMLVAVYEVKMKDGIRVDNKKAGLRNLIKSVNKIVDAALIVFDSGNSWRFSYISEIYTLDENGKSVRQETDPKRYTYVLGINESCTTAASRLLSLVDKKIALKDLTEAFSVEKLNEEFYRQVVKYFYRLVGGKVGNAKQAVEFKSELALPSLPVSQHRKVYQEFAVRLIGRLVFCWFLKYKKSKAEIPLISAKILSRNAIEPNYYHQVLEKLFFGLLNTKSENRKANLPQDAHLVPFLNGGLFEPQTDDFYLIDSEGNSLNTNILQIPDQWFKDLFEMLEQYNFTIDENSTDEVEVSIDPEMLGRIFENLLAEIDPESGETARKATGSFYTPREIVDYMVNQSLIKYLHQKTALPETQLLSLFEGKDTDFTLLEKVTCINALDTVRILDPACGSGAFPMGALQKIVRVLQTLDPDASLWKNRQLARIDNAIVKKYMREKLNSSSADYIRKLGIIQNSIYGLDIQPIAAEISKLRCFLTLVVDENINDSAYNRGIEPLPNLEFKFVTANSLKALPEGSANTFSNDFITQLQQIRSEYLQASGEEKIELKARFKEVQDQLFDLEITQFGKDADLSKINAKGLQIAQWRPFSHDCADWFDADWMFGITDGFDIVLGNPPYGGTKISDELKTTLTLASKDPYGAFIARFMHLRSRNTHLREGGILAFIVSDTFMTIKSHFELRKYLMDNTLHQIIRVHPDTFKATVNTAILIAERSEAPATHTCVMSDLTQVSIHENHDLFVRLLRGNVGDVQKTNEISAFYQYPQSLIKQNSHLPFFVASPKLFALLNDTTAQTAEITLQDENLKPESTATFQKLGLAQIQLFGNEGVKGQLDLLKSTPTSTTKAPKTIQTREILMNGKTIQVVKLGQIADVKQGLATGDNDAYLFQNPEARGNYRSIREYQNFLLTEQDLTKIRNSETLRLEIIEKGISKNDEESKRYFGGRYIVPYDKGGESDSEGGWLPNYFVPTNYFIDWSEWAINRMNTFTIAQRIREYKESKEIKKHYETTNCAVFRSTDTYFKQGLSFSRTGVYAPTFRLNSNSPFDTEGSTILFLDNLYNKNYLAFLASNISKYFLKAFLGHSVHCQVDELKELPVLLIEDLEINHLVEQIIEKQKENPRYDYASEEQLEIDRLVYEAYGLDAEDIQEVEHWYMRRYPKLAAAQAENLRKKGLFE